MANMKDVAEHAGVSVSTVSRVMRQHPNVTDEMRERVLRASSALGFRANAVARSMRIGQSRSLGLVVRDMRSANFAEICASAEAVAEANNYDLFVCNSNRSPHKERRYFESLLERQVDVVIAFTADDYVNNLDIVYDAGKAVVLVSSGLFDDRADRVETCDVAAAATATEHLIKLGHRRIGYIASGQQIPSGRERLAGFAKAHVEAGLHLDPSLVRHCGFELAKAATEVRVLMEREPRPSALIISSANLLLDVLRAVRSLRLSPPGDLSIVAFDDHATTQLFAPPLTVMRRSLGDIGRRAMELALHRIADPSAPPQRVAVPFSLIERSSTGRPPSEAINASL